MAKMNKKSGFLIILGVFFGPSSVCFANNPTDEATIVEIGGHEDSDSKASKEEPTSGVVNPSPATTVKGKIKGAMNRDSSKENQPKDVPQAYERQAETQSNLPRYAKRSSQESSEYQDPSVETTQTSQFGLYELKRGTSLNAIIEGNIVAYPDSQAPVSAIVTAPEKYKRAKILGTASLDTSTKRINIEFDTLILATDSTSYTIKGITSDRTGKLGLNGVHKTDYWNWLWAEVLVRSSGGLVEASEDKEHSIFGSSTSVTPSNAAKKGVATGLNTMADRFGEKRSKAIEMTEVSGPTAISVSIVQ
jgi:hypothetical protein